VHPRADSKSSSGVTTIRPSRSYVFGGAFPCLLLNHADCSHWGNPSHSRDPWHPEFSNEPAAQAQQFSEETGLYVYTYNSGLPPWQEKKKKKNPKPLVQRCDHCGKSAKAKTSSPGTLRKPYAALGADKQPASTGRNTPSCWKR